MNYPKYEYLEHTADAKIKAYGKTLEEAFENGAYATFSLLGDISKVNDNLSYDIEIKSKKITSLLFDFIDELLFHLDVDGFILSKVESLKIKERDDEFHIKTKVKGDYFKNYEVSGNVKGMTYNDMEINQESEIKNIIFVVDL